MTAWWRRLRLATRITVLVSAAALTGFAVAAQVIAGLFAHGLQRQLDEQLRAAVLPAASAVQQGNRPDAVPQATVRVLDTAGTPVDGGGFIDLTDQEKQRLRAGQPVTSMREYGSTRWSGITVSTPTGAQRLVVARTTLGEYLAAGAALRRWSLPLAFLAAGVVGLTAYLSVGFALRPVQRMRVAAESLPPGARLPNPQASDELAELAGALNALLRRRDDANERMRTFSSAAAHELRSPVSSIRVQAEVGVAHPDPDSAQETLESIAGEAQRLSGMLEELLASARAESEAVDPPERPVELVALVREVLARPEYREVAPVISVETFLPVTVVATAGEVTVILENLLRNAVRYAHAQVRVTVLPHGRHGRLVVDDDGPGVPAEHRRLLFDRLYRADPARDRAGGGAGLGLATAAELLRRRGGSAWAGVSPEGGARLEMRWPSA